MIIIVAAAAALLAALLAPRVGVLAVGTGTLDRADQRLRTIGPVVIPVLSVIVVWYAWGELRPTPKVHDESSYVLQADIFAGGRWTAPSPPIPDFFEEPHVLVVPAVASKYPPGHALLLSVGAFVGFTALVPLLLTAITALLAFMLVARLWNPWIALVSWIVWVTAPMILRFQPGYFSEVTTTPLLLGSWWSLLRWRETRARRWLLIVALLVGWGAITRPLTMLACALPIGFIVVRDTVRLRSRRSWRDFAGAVIVGTAVLAILPLWSAKTTGNWKLSPIEAYRRDYLPFDKIGFTIDTTPPRRTVSPVLKSAYDYFLIARKEQRLGAVPAIAADRLLQLTIAFFQGWRLTLLPFALAGLFAASGPLMFALASAVVLFVAHLPYAHWAPWTIYYLEMAPVAATLVAVGIWRALQRVVATEGQMRMGAALASCVLVVFALPTIRWWHGDHRARSALDRQFAERLRALPPHSIVFVRYTPRITQHMAVVHNSADLAHEPVWVVHDLGARNDELRRLAPDRASFDFEEDQLVRRIPIAQR